MLIIDDLKGRKEAKSLKINYTGTIGILVIAKEKGIIKSLKQTLNSITKTNFRINDKLIQKALLESGE